MFTQMEFKRCSAALVREHWFMGECRGEADVLYLEIDGRDWYELAYDKDKQAFIARPTSSEEAHRVFGSGESHHPVKDIFAQYHLVNCMITRIDQQQVATGGELCLMLDNATEITIHCNPQTQESSLYITHH